MKTLIYLAQVSACTGIFFLFYKLILSRFTFFTLNRFYLLATLMISFSIPLISIPADSPQPLQVFKTSVVAEQVFIPASQPATSAIQVIEEPFDWQSLATNIYFLAVFALAIHLLSSILHLYLRLRNKEAASMGNIKVIKDDQKFKNGSFLNYIFLDSEKLSNAELEQVLAHELAHIRLLHTVDKIFARLVQVILWFNPFSYLYIKAIAENHEFEVDRCVTLGTDKNEYAELLLKLSVSPESSLYHHFSMIPLRRRIQMLFTKPTKSMKKVLYGLVAPLVLISCLAFANRELTIPNSTIGKALKSVTIQIHSVAKATSDYTLEVVSTDSIKAEMQKVLADTTQTPRLSAIGGIDKLGKNPLVRIDGKFVDPAVLYEISPSCISGAATFRPNPDFEKWGKKLPDGAVDITTKNGIITYLTKIDRENLITTYNAGKGFFVRYKLTKNDGTIEEMVQLNLREGMAGSTRMSRSIRPNGKAGFLLGNKFFTENQVKEFEEALLATKPKGTSGVGGIPKRKIPGLDLSSYDIIFDFEMPDTVVQNKQGISIEGAVVRPGVYEMKNSGISLRQLIQNAEGLREDAFRNRAYIVRRRSDGQSEMIAFDLGKVISAEIADIPLKEGDLVRVSSIFGLKEYYIVQISGEVNQPGTFNYKEGMTLEDLLKLAGNLKEGTTANRIDIARRTNRNNNTIPVGELIMIDIDKNLSSKGSKYVLQPFDIVSIRPSLTQKVEHIKVKIVGAVQRPGDYEIPYGTKIYQLVKMVGGLREDAFQRVGTIYRASSGENNRKSSTITYDLAQYLDEKLTNLNLTAEHKDTFTFYTKEEAKGKSW